MAIASTTGLEGTGSVNVALAPSQPAVETGETMEVTVKDLERALKRLTKHFEGFLRSVIRGGDEGDLMFNFDTGVVLDDMTAFTKDAKGNIGILLDSMRVDYESLIISFPRNDQVVGLRVELKIGEQ